MTKLYCVQSPSRYGTREQWFRRGPKALAALAVVLSHLRKGQSASICTPDGTLAFNK